MRGSPAEFKPAADAFLNEHIRTRGFMLGRPEHAEFVEQESKVLFLRAEPENACQNLYELDLDTKKERLLLSPENLLRQGAEVLSAEERARRERLRLSMGGFVQFFKAPGSAHVLIPYSGKLFLLEVKRGKTRELPIRGPTSSVSFSPDGTKLAYVRSFNLYTFDLATRQERALTRGGEALNCFGSAEYVAQEEMGRMSGYWWAPDGKNMLIQETDTRHMEIWRLVDPANPALDPQPWPYPRPGRENAKVKLAIHHLSRHKKIHVKWDDQKFPYLVRAQWHKRGGLSLLVQSRDQHLLLLLKVDVRSGKTREILREKGKDWVPIDQDVPRWLESGEAFLWTSVGKTDKELQLRKADGGLIRVVLPQSFGLRRLLRLNTREKYVYVSAGANPTVTQIYRVPLAESGIPIALTPDDAVSSAKFGSAGKLIVSSTSASRMPQTSVRFQNGNTLKLESRAREPVLRPNLTIEQVQSDEGDLYTAILRPSKFEPKRKYPVIVYTYGGPSRALVQAAMGSWLMLQWLCEQGFCVVSIDGKGTPGRGREWETAIASAFETVPLAGQVAGLKALGSKHPELDLSRVGIMGWSFGGYLSALAVMQRPDVFHAAVAGAPVTEWHDYDTHYTERFLGVPPAAEEVYRRSSLIEMAPKLERPLLLIHGTIDDNVFFKHSLDLAAALTRHGKEFEFLPLARQSHMISDPELMRERWIRTWKFFKKNL